jgi:hypothetical protein
MDKFYKAIMCYSDLYFSALNFEEFLTLRYVYFCTLNYTFSAVFFDLKTENIYPTRAAHPIFRDVHKSKEPQQLD